MLSKVIASTKRLVTSLKRARMSYIQKDERSFNETQKSDKKKRNSRLSWVWILRTCRFKCSLRIKHLPQPGTTQIKVLFSPLGVLLISGLGFFCRERDSTSRRAPWSIFEFVSTFIVIFLLDFVLDGFFTP